MPVWQALRDELKDRNFEIVAVACESKGSEAAEPWVRAAEPRFPTLLDVNHVVAELYNTRNVPAGIWIDEQGFIVRPPEVAYGSQRRPDSTERAPHEKYLRALRDWVEHGPRSIYVLKPGEVQQRTVQPTAEDAQAMASFRLGVYLYRQGHGEDAIPHFKQAQTLKPENWNYKRQAWNLGDAERDYGTTFRQEVERVGPAYAPLDLPDLPQG